MTLYAATTNQGKLREFALAAGDSVEIKPVTPLSPVDETGDTFEENARLKAAAYSKLVDGWLFAEDSGLEVMALGGAPGVHSARYAGPIATDSQNNTKLVGALLDQPDRRARYVCVIALARQGEVVASFRGEVEGEIVDKGRGQGGFGYDPHFFYPPFAATFAEVPAEKKFLISHRRRALDQMFAWLRDGV
jgi:XTP/dITP diphosphohydrolase